MFLQKLLGLDYKSKSEESDTSSDNVIENFIFGSTTHKPIEEGSKF